MPLPSTLIPISSITLTSTASSITFSNIPQTYTDLKLIAVAQQSADSPTYIRFNGDTGANYATCSLAGDGSSVGTQRISSWDPGIWYRSEFIAEGGSNFGMFETHINNYASSSIYKNVISRPSAAAGSNTVMVGMIAGSWKSTAAINTINFYPASTTWTAGSTFTLYGIKAAS